MGIYPPFFGPIVWDNMMLFATNYPNEPTNEDKTNMLQWLTLTMIFLPCGGCSMHGKAYIEKHPPNVSTKENLIKYIVEFHNYVNVSLKKSTYTIMEAKAAFASRIARDIKDLPRAMVVHKEDALRIMELKDKLEKYEANQDPITNSLVYFYTTIALSIALGLFLIIIIILAVKLNQNKLRLRK